jgi:hypothetical protein
MAGREEERFPIGAGTIAWPNPLAINLDSSGRRAKCSENDFDVDFQNTDGTKH